MPSRMVPMLHVPDVEATARWYVSIGFTVRMVHQEEGCEVSFAQLSLGDGQLMLNAGGVASTAARREVDLYWYVDAIAPLFAQMAGKAEVVEGIHDTFYGRREFIIKDLNGFWLTFSQDIPR